MPTKSNTTVSRKKRIPPRRILSKRIAILFFTGFLASTQVFALPRGEQVGRGSASFNREGNQMTIRAGNGSIINYQNFDIGRGETVRFVQPGENARVLNRVMDGNPTQIFGRLESNGRVYLVNPSGVFFENGAVLNVGSLIAGAGSFTDADFIAGRDHFTNLTGEVVNRGQITAMGDVGLFGSAVTNLGSVISQTGTVAIAAGDEVLYGDRGGNVFVSTKAQTAPSPKGVAIQQQGTIQARRTVLATGDVYSIAIAPGSSITSPDIAIKGGRNGTATVSGTLNASAKNPGRIGGKVKITAGSVELRGATINAVGPAGGGEILIGGDTHGQGTLPRAKTTTVDARTTIKADASSKGTGGKVVVWSEQSTVFDGTISAQGAGAAAGGFAEVSGRSTLAFRGNVNLKGGGETQPAGTLLLDPANVTIDNSTDNLSGTSIGGDPNVYGNSTASSTVTWSRIVNQLVTANVIITTSDNGNSSGAGNISILAGTTYNRANNLTLLAHSTISLASGSAITNTGSGGLALLSGWDGVDAANPAFTASGTVLLASSITASGGVIRLRAGSGGIDLSGTATINAGSGPINIDAGANTVNLAGTVKTTNGTASAIAVTAGPLTVGNLSAGAGGGIALNHSGAGQQAAGTTISGAASLIKTGPGILTLSAANIYTGSTVINGGVVAIRSDANLGAAPGVPSADHLVLDGGTLRTTATLALAGTRGIGLGAGGGTLEVTTGTTAYGGVIGNLSLGVNGGLTKAGNGILTLAGGNTYGGNTVIADGQLRLGASNVIPDGLGKGNVVVNPVGTLNLNGFDETINGLSGGGSVNNATALGGSHNTLTVGAGDATSAFTGGIVDSAGVLALAKIGNGTLALSGNNNYSGTTTISSGILSAESRSALGATEGGTTVAAGGTLALAGSISIDEPIALAGTLLNAAGTNEVTAGVTLVAGGAPTVSVAAASALTLGSVVGTFDLLVNNSGTLTFGSSVGGLLTPLNSLAVSGTGATVVKANVTTLGGQSYNQDISTIGNVTLTANEVLFGTRISPGGDDTPATLTVGGNLRLSPGATYFVTLNSRGQDKIKVSGTTTLTGALLAGKTPENDTAPDADKEFSILSTTFRTGDFANATPPAMVTISGLDYVVAYNGVNVTLTPPHRTLTWDGGGADDLWSNRLNWTGNAGGSRPRTGDAVEFGSSTISIMNLANLALTQLHFTGGGNTINFASPGSLLLAGPDAILNDTGTNTINAPIVIAGDNTTFTVTAGGLTFGGGINSDATARSLTIKTGPVATDPGVVFGAAVGTVPLNQLTVIGNAPLTIGANVTTTGAQSYAPRPIDLPAASPPVYISADAILNANTASIRFGSTVTVGGSDLTLRANSIAFSGNDSVTGTAAGSMSFEAGTAGGTIGVLTGGDLQISQDIYDAVKAGFGSVRFGRPDGTGAIISGDLVLKTPTTFLSNTGPITLGAVNGDPVNGTFALTVTTAGDTTLTAPLGALVPLASVLINGGGKLAVNGGGVKTSGPQTYADAMTLGGEALFQGTDLTFSNTVKDDGIAGTSSKFTATSSVSTTFGGEVGRGGASSVLTSLTSNGGGTTRINGGGVKTSGEQAYEDPVTLGGDASLEGGTIRFASTIDDSGSAATAANLTVTSSGAITLGGAIGTAPSRKLGSVTVNGGGTIALNGGIVTTSGNQSYSNAMTLGTGTVLSGRDISFGNSVNDGAVAGGSGLTIRGTGEITLGGPVGNQKSLGSLFVDGGTTTFVQGDLIQTIGLQTYGSPVLLRGDTNLVSTATGDIEFKSTVASSSQPRALSVLTDGLVIFDGLVGRKADGSGALQSLTTGGAGFTQFKAAAEMTFNSDNTVTLDIPSVTTVKGQTYSNTVTLYADTGLRSIDGAKITFDSTVDAFAPFQRASAQGQALVVENSGITTFNDDIGNTVPPSYLVVGNSPGGAVGSTVLDGKINSAAATDFGLVGFYNPVTLNGSVQIGSGDASLGLPFVTGEVFFHESIVSGAPSNFDLTVSTAGRVTLAGNVGPVTTTNDPTGRIGNLTINQPAPLPGTLPPAQPNDYSTTIIRLGSVGGNQPIQIATTGRQIYEGLVEINKTVTLRAETTLSAPLSASVSIRDGIVDDGDGTLKIVAPSASSGLSRLRTQLVAGDVYLGGPVGFNGSAGLTSLTIQAGHDIFVQDVHARTTLTLGARDKLYLVGDSYVAGSVISFNPSGHPTFDLKSTIIHNNPAKSGLLLQGTDGPDLEISTTKFLTGPREALYVDAGSLSIKAKYVKVGDVAAAKDLSIQSPAIYLIGRPPTFKPTPFGQDLGVTMVAGERLLLSSTPILLPTGRNQRAFRFSNAGTQAGVFFQQSFAPDQPVGSGEEVFPAPPEEPIAEETAPAQMVIPAEAALVSAAPFVRLDNDDAWEAEQLGLLDPALQHKLMMLGIWTRSATPEEVADLRKRGYAIYRQPKEGKRLLNSSDYEVVLNRITLQEVLRITGYYDQIGGRSSEQQEMVIEILQRAAEKWRQADGGTDAASFARWLRQTAHDDTDAADSLEILHRLNRIFAEIATIGLSDKEQALSRTQIAFKFGRGSSAPAGLEGLIRDTTPSELHVPPFQMATPPTPMPASLRVAQEEPVPVMRLEAPNFEPEQPLPFVEREEKPPVQKGPPSLFPSDYTPSPAGARSPSSSEGR